METINKVGLAVNPAIRTLSPQEGYADHAMLRDLIQRAIAEVTGVSNNPCLARIIQPGMTVLVKPNWVLHTNHGGYGMECMVTQHAFTLAALEHVFAAKPGKVIIGDAPVQSCQWDKLVTVEFRNMVQTLAQKSGVSVQIQDFRRTVAIKPGIDVQTDVRRMDRYVLFDLGGDSMLEPVSEPPGRFRVTNYNPDKLAQTHGKDVHKYLICRDVFEADIVLSMPKLKLHRKAGLTGALKNLVGINGNKDYLPHHRAGGTLSHGDCYEGRSPQRRLAEFFMDAANRRIGRPSYKALMFMSSLLKRYSTTEEEGCLEGSWHGNDTCWRMVLDLNRIVLYGSAAGQMSDTLQRRLYTLTDAIICGQGEGPLRAEPLNVGAVTFSASAPAADYFHALLLKMDPQKISLVREAAGDFRWPLSPQGYRHAIYENGRELSAPELLAEYAVEARPPVGWAGHIELD